MITFAAVVPHSPLLISSIGKEHREKLHDTLAAYATLEQALYISKPDTIVMLSPHAPMYPDAFSGNMSDKFVGQLKEFGDHGTTLQAQADYLLMDHIHRLARQENVPFTLTSQEELDYGYTVPLLLLTSHLKSWKLLPLAPSLLDAHAHFEFGRQIKRVIHAEARRVALIASVDLSHHANAQAPNGATPEGQQFDTLIREKLKALDAPGMLSLDQDMIEKAGSCAYPSLLVLLGALDNLNVKATELCYEAPFGVGCLSAMFQPA
ncbi:MAG: AmmeMemoRadiSam system protein B [bacterium]|nr:AmmeMemoRadiSam system protein B [bacterium]